jgi:hypothetical protein
MPTDRDDAQFFQVQPIQQAPAPQPAPTAVRRPVQSPPSPKVILRQATEWPDHPPRPEPLLETVRNLSKARRIAYLNHGEFRFETRFAEMGFDVFDMYYVLEHGRIDGKIEAGRKQGEWKAKIIDVPEGTSRTMGVVTIVVQEKRLLIKTVEWEDR